MQSNGAFEPNAYRAGTAIRFSGICDNSNRQSRYAPISTTLSSARANAVPVARIGGPRSRSSTENREPSGVISFATGSPGSAGPAAARPPVTVACRHSTATFRTSDTCSAGRSAGWAVTGCCSG